MHDPLNEMLGLPVGWGVVLALFDDEVPVLGLLLGLLHLGVDVTVHGRVIVAGLVVVLLVFVVDDVHSLVHLWVGGREAPVSLAGGGVPARRVQRLALEVCRRSGGV